MLFKVTVWFYISTNSIWVIQFVYIFIIFWRFHYFLILVILIGIIDGSLNLPFPSG